MVDAICLAVGCTEPRHAGEIFCIDHGVEWEGPAAPPRKRTIAARPAVVCRNEDCARTARVKGLCKRCYRAVRRSEGKEPPRPWDAEGPVDVPCTECGKVTRRWVNARRKPFCSWDCRADHQYGADRRGRMTPVSVVAVSPSPVSDVVVTHPAPTDGIPRASDDYKPLPAFKIEPSVRYAIYDRDKWVCQLCMDRVDPTLLSPDPWAASLDHIECQSWVLFPDHSPSNLRLAHRWCNSVRNNERRYSADDLAASEHVAERRALSQRRTARSRGIDRNKLWWTTPTRAYI